MAGPFLTSVAIATALAAGPGEAPDKLPAYEVLADTPHLNTRTAASDNLILVWYYDHAPGGEVGELHWWNDTVFYEIFVRSFHDSDGDQKTFQIVAVGQASHGGTLGISEDGQRITYTPADGFEGLDSFTYTIEDDEGYQAEATVQVQVTTLDGGNSHQVWREQVELQLLEAAVQRSGPRFGSFDDGLWA